MNRRKFLKSLGAAGAAGLLTGFYAWQIEPFWLEFVRLPMPIANLPAHLQGKTLMQISDLHVGERFKRSYLTDSLKKAQLFEPDFVVYTGDFVTYESARQLEQLEEVFQDSVKGKIGTFGILGNHDYGKNWSQTQVADRICAINEAAGIRMLRNEKATISGLTITGLDDMWGPNFRPEKILKSIRPEAANLVLCHNPDALDRDIWHNYRGWILAGHTHGGQCKPPFLPPPLLPVKNKMYTAGRINLTDGRTLYINRALGHLHQVRFNVRPEITIFTLQKCKT